jgi:hypothetical protein
MVTEALSLSNGNQSAAARLLGFAERHLRSRSEKLGMKKWWVYSIENINNFCCKKNKSNLDFNSRQC